MFPTVAQVLELDVLRRGNPQVVAGAAGLEHPVRWVHISELADVAGMLRGGELVLTTGVMLPAEREPLARYIEDLADVGAAGLVVELGRRYADELPRPLVRAAERRQEDWRTVFPSIAERAEADRWFDYAAEDAFLAAR